MILPKLSGSHRLVKFCTALNNSYQTHLQVQLSRYLSSLSKHQRMSWFTYNYALVRNMPKSFESEAIRMDMSQVVDFAKARQQFELYKETLTKLGLKLITVEADEQYPDCIFVEDTAVIIGEEVLITRPGHPNRRGEIGPIMEALKKELKRDIKEIKDDDATVDGGDVLFTGKEILVGLSTRTNKKGIEKLAETFSQFPVTPIPVHPSVLHLKSIATLVEEDVLAVGGSPAAKEMFQSIKTSAKYKYNYLEMEKDMSSNVLYVNGTVVHKTREEMGDKDYETLTTSLKSNRVEVCLDEMYKVDGCLTCCSVFIS